MMSQDTQPPRAAQFEATQVSSAGAVVAVEVWRPAEQSREALPIVLLPGMVIGGYLWRDTVPFLVEQGFVVLTIRDPTAMIDASIERLQLHMEAVLDAFGLSRVILCGNSIGGLLAVDFAASYPQRVRAIVVSGAPGLKNEYDVDLGARRTVDRAVVLRLGERIVYDRARIPPEAVDDLLLRFGDRRFRRNLALSLRATRHFDATTSLPQIKCPVLLVWGEKDSLTSAAEWKSSMHMLQRASFVEIAGSGHAPMFESPDVFNPLLLTFLNELEG